MGLLRKAVLIGAGYVLGARAGTDRYDDIVRTAKALAARPEVQRYVTALRDKAGLREPAPAARDVVVLDAVIPGLDGLSSRETGLAASASAGEAALGSPVDPASARRPLSDA